MFLKGFLKEGNNELHIPELSDKSNYVLLKIF